MATFKTKRRFKRLRQTVMALVMTVLIGFFGFGVSTKAMSFSLGAPVLLSQPPLRAVPDRLVTLIAEEQLGDQLPIHQYDSHAGTNVGPTGVPNLTYFNAPNGSFQVTPWQNIHWGDSVTVYWGIQNNGSGDIATGTTFYVRFYLSTDDVISTSDYPWYTFYRSVGLSAGFYISGDFTLALPSSPPDGFPSGGTTYIGMYVDYDNRIAESDETDNRNQGLFNDYDYVTIVCPSPGIPALLSPPNGSSVEGTGIDLDWSTVSGSDYYQVQVDDSSSFSSPLVDVTTSGSYYEIPYSLNPTYTWYWRIRAHNDCGYGSWSSTWSFTICSYPNTPTLYSPANGASVEGTGVDLDWSTVSSSDYYQVQVDDSSSFSSPLVDVTTSGSYYEIPFSLVPGTTWYWRVRAHNTCGYGSWFSTWSFTICSYPNTPTLYSPANGASVEGTGVDLDWSTVSGSDYYQVQVDDSSSFTSPLVDVTTSGSYYEIPFSLVPGTTWYWRIRAHNDCGYGSWSSTWSFTICSYPNTPTLYSPANGASVEGTGVDLDWSTVSGSDYYQVQVANNPSFTSPLVDDTTSSSAYEIPYSLNPTYTWYWRIRAHNTCGYGDWSSTWSFTICSYPDTTTLYSPADGASVEGTGVDLDWSTVSGSDYYQVQVDDSSSFTSPLVDVTTSGSYYEIPFSLVPGTNWYWRIRAHNDCGYGDWSSTWGFSVVADEILSMTPSPAPPQNGIVGQDFHLGVDVLADLHQSGALQVDIQGANLSILDSHCVAIFYPSGLATWPFSLDFHESSPGSVDHILTARFRPGETCDIQDSQLGDLSQTYAMTWDYPSNEILSMTPSPAPPQNGIVGQDFHLDVDVLADLHQSGALQVDIQGANLSILDSHCVAIFNPSGLATWSFGLDFHESSPSSVDHILTARFRPGETCDIQDSQLGDLSQTYAMTWDYPSNEILSMTPSPAPPQNGIVGQDFHLGVDVLADLHQSGALQVDIQGVNLSILGSHCVAIFNPSGLATWSFGLDFHESSPSSVDHILTARFRPGETCDIQDSQLGDLVQTYAMTWDYPSNEILSLIPSPAPPQNGIVGQDFHLDVDVLADLHQSGALQVDIQGVNLSILGSHCVPIFYPSGLATWSFSLDFHESSPGSIDHILTARFRPGETCDIQDSQLGDLSQTYAMTWDYPPNEILSLIPSPASPQNGTVGQDFHLQVAVEANIYQIGALQVDVRDSSTLVLKDRDCRWALGDSVQYFDLYIPESNLGNKDYTITARFRPGGSCYIQNSQAGDLSEPYSIDWLAIPTLQAIAIANPADANPDTTVQLIGSQSTGNPETHFWEWISGPARIVPDYNWKPDTRVTLTKPGVYYYKLTVTKGDQHDSATVQINVGQIPTADAGDDQTGLTAGSTVYLDGSGSDPLGRQLHFQWEQTDGTGVQLSDPAVPNPSFVVAEPDSYEFRLIVWVEQDEAQVKSDPSYVRISTGGSGTIGGIIYQDTNSDGSYTPGVDTTVSGATVRVGDQSTQSEPDGSYSLSLTAGTHNLSANKPGGGTGFRFGVMLLPGEDLTNIHIGLDNQNCQTVAGIPVCADDLSEAAPGVWVGYSNVRIGSHLIVGGHVSADMNPGQERIEGSGEVRFDLWDGTTLPVYQGDYEINIQAAVVDMLGTYTRELLDIAGLRLSGLTPDTEPAIVLNINGQLTVTNARIEFQKPSQATLDVVEFVVNDQGEFSGSVQGFTTEVGGMDLVVSDAQFNNEGLVLDGVLTLPDSLSGGNSTLSVDDLALTKDGVEFASIQLDNYTLHIGAMTATLTTTIITNDGIQATGKVHIPSDITPEPITYENVLITRDGIEGGKVHLERVQDLKIGPATFNLHQATLEMVSTDDGTKPIIFVTEAEMTLDDQLGGGEAVVHDLEISDEGISFRDAHAVLPTIRVAQFTVKDSWIHIERRQEGGYAFAGEGTLVIDKLAPGKDNTRIIAGVRVYITDGELFFEEAHLSIQPGIRIPLGSTGAYLTGIDGSVDFTQEDPEFSVSIDLEAGPRVGELVAISGRVDTTINLRGWMHLEGNMKLFSYEVTQVSLSINEPGVSEKGVRGSLHLDVFAIFIGDATVYVYIDDSGHPAVEGSADVLIQVPVAKLPPWARVLVGDDLENMPLGRATATLGKFNDVYGINARATYLNPLKPEEPLFELTVFVDAGGKLDLGVDWHNPFVMASAHVFGAERHVILPDRSQRGLKAGVQQDNSLVQLDGNAQWVAFYLDATGYPDLTFSLMDPAENLIDADNVALFPNVTLGRLGEQWTYLVANPIAGDWYMIVDGIVGGETYQSEAFVKDSAPSVVIDDIAGVGLKGQHVLEADSYDIAWTAQDPEGSASLALYYDTDSQGLNGTLIAEGLALAASPYAWTPGELTTGAYYVYAKVEDGVNAPEYSYFDTPMQVTNTTAPATPTGIGFRAGAATTVLTWTHNTEPDLGGYVVHYGSEPGPLTEVLTTTESSVNVPRPDRSRPLTMTVTAFDHSGNWSAPSAAVVLVAERVDDTTSPKIPAVHTPELVGLDARITWDSAQAQGDLAGYQVYYDTRSGAPYLGTEAQEGSSPVRLGDTTELMLHGLPQGRALFVVVTAFDDSGNESLPSQEKRLRITDGIDGDGDGLPDDFELAYWAGVDEVDGSSDTDYDGMAEAMEYLSFTLPLDADSDGDGTSDGDEASSGTDPLDPAYRPSLEITTRTLPTGTVDLPYSAQLEAISGTLPYTWTLLHQHLPDGLELSLDGEISGTPTESGRFHFIVGVQDANGEFDRQGLTLQVESTVAATAPSSISINGPVTGTLYISHVFTATVSPVTTTLPITYAWQATGQAPVTRALDELSDTVTFVWDVTGTQTIVVAGANAAGGVTATHEIVISEGLRRCWVRLNDEPTYYDTVQAAVDASTNPADVVKVAGYCTGIQVRDGISQVVYISKTLTIQGGYNVGDWDTPDPGAHPTTLDAEGQGRVLYIGGNVSPTITGLRLSRGDASGLGGPETWGITRDTGGGVYVLTATATISNCWIISSTAEHGGGLALVNSASTIRSDTLTGNTASQLGGGVFLLGSEAQLSGNQIATNTSQGGWGGGAYLLGSPATISGNSIVSNLAADNGGGLFLDQSDATLVSNNVSSNSAIYGGGGAYLNVSDALLNSNEFADNVAGQYGGGLQLWRSNSTLIGNVVQSNTADMGGGLYVESSETSLAANTIVGNAAHEGPGGGLYLLESLGTLTNNTVVSNTASASGGGLYLAESDARLNSNRIVSNTAAQHGGGIKLWASTATLGMNWISANDALDGGGMHLGDSAVTLTNTMVVDNQASAHGSGIYVWGASPHLLHTTISRNTGGDGSGVYVTNNGAAYSTVTLTNTILVSQAMGIQVTGGSTVTLEATLWGQGGWANAIDWNGAGAISVGSINAWEEPAFVDPNAGDYHIGPGSGAIDLGMNVRVLVDIDGEPRPAGTGFDVGADEYLGASIPVEEVMISGPIAGDVNVDHVFTAVISPGIAAQPITYAWQATGQLPVTHTNGLEDSVSFSWSVSGTKAVTVTATNVGGLAIDTHTVAIQAGYVISGHVREQSGVGVEGVAVDFGGARPAVTTDSSGYYEQAGFGNSEYIVSFNHSGYTFSPMADQVTVSDGNLTHNATAYPFNYASIPFSDSFEGGDLGDAWAVETDYEGQVQVSTSYPYTGSYSLLLDDDTGNATPSHASVILGLDLGGQTDVALSFFWREFSDEDDGDDGVFISDDYGTTWHKVFSFNGGPPVFGLAAVDLGAQAAVAGISLNDHFLVKFQFRDNYPIPSDGYAIDDVQVANSFGITSVIIEGPRTGGVGIVHTFTASARPPNATQPITYTWQATGQPASVHVGGTSDSTTFTWHITGTQAVTVSTTNVGGFATDTHTLTIVDAMRVLGFAPSANSHTVPLTATISVTYDRPIDATTINTRTLSVHAMQTGLLTETYSIDGDTAHLTPPTSLRPGELVQVSVTTGTLGLDGRRSIIPTVWQFRAAVSGGGGTFVDSGQSLESTSSPESYAVALGDLDRDGDLDAVVGSNSAGEVWLNDGSGVFTNTGQSLSHLSFDLALGDLDDDGDLDAFLARISSQPNEVWLNDGHGDLTNSGQSLGNRSSRAVALGDLDGDGDLDAFVGNYDSLPNEVWLNDGSGHFSNSGQNLGGSSSRAIALGDLDGDRDLDAYVGNDGGQPDKVWLNDGTGHFSDSGQNLGSSNSLDVVLGDLDGDGDLDSVTGNSGPSKTWLNSGNGTFTAGQDLTNDGQCTDLGDVDGDGDLDLFIGTQFANRIWLNDGTGNFDDSGQRLGWDDSEAAALGDLDGDGDLDLFVANGGWGGGPNKVWLNQPRNLGTGVIVYACSEAGNADICTVNADDTNQQHLTTTSEQEGMPRWSPDGARIAFQRLGSDGWMDLWLMHADGSGQCKLYDGDDPYSLGIAWHPYLDRVYFTPGADSGSAGMPHSLVWVPAVCGPHTPTAVEGAPATNYLEIDISPDGTKLVSAWYASHSFASQQEICVSDLAPDGASMTSPVCYTSDSQTDSSPRFSPDGLSIIWQHESVSGDPDLWKMELDGNNPHQLPAPCSQTGAQDIHPDYSPDGRYYIFASERGSYRKLWIAPDDCSQVWQLTSGDFDDSEPDWYGMSSLTHVGLVPAANTHTAPLTTTVSIIYNRAIDPTTVSTRTLAVHAMQTGLLTQTYDVAGGTVRLTPPQSLKPGELVQVSATTGTVSLDEQEPDRPVVWQFWAIVDEGSGVLADSGQSLQSVDSPYSYALALGDLNGDGHLDALVGSNGAAEIWLNDGIGAYSNTYQDLPHLCFGLALGDLDADGDLDAFFGRISDQPNEVWLNDGNGVFSDTGQRLGTSTSRAVALGDLDGDGDLDAYVGNYDGQPDKIWLNDGQAHFADTGQNLGSLWSRAVALGDLDLDGDLDAFIGNTHGPNKVWLNDGTGNMTSTLQDIGDSWSTTVALGDLDGDADLDAFVGNSGPVAVWLNDGTGIFSHQADLDGGYGITLGDLDGDGDLDAVAVGQSQNRAWLNDGYANFDDSGQRLGETGGLVVALGDLDSDGDLDAFVGNNGPNKIWLNCNGLCAAEIDGPANGLVDAYYNFTAYISPIQDGQPTEYVWQATGQSTVTHTGSLSDTATFSWTIPGPQVITVTATNAGYAVSATHSVTIGLPSETGLIFEYYEGQWSALPDFDLLTPVLVGSVTNFDLSPRQQDDYFAFRFTGYLQISTTGTYTFYVGSDDGSQLYIGHTLVVDNDGLHSYRERSGSLPLVAGCHPITVTFFEAGGSQELTVQYEGPGISKQPIPDGALACGGSATLVPVGATWKYLDNGFDQGTNWSGLLFDDSAWLSGMAQLGYGDGDETTVVSYGPDGNNKYITTYFRHAFEVSNPGSFSSLLVRLLRDDGAIVYLNGTEVFRSNMPTGTIDYLTTASSVIGGEDENIFQETHVSPTLLLNGINVIAVEIHQADGTSSDISFDLELIGEPGGAGDILTHAIALVPGWNLVSWPLVPISTNLTDTLAPLGSACDAAQAYDPWDDTGRWKKWPGNLAQVDETMGVWLHVTEPITLTVDGRLPTDATIELRVGWNLVGYPSSRSQPVAEALASIAGCYSLVQTFDATDPDDPWKRYDVDLPPYANDLAVMEPGHGYWIYVTTPCTLGLSP